MTSQESATYLARSLRFQHFVRTALLVLFLGQLLTVGVRAAEDAADPYDVLYDVIMTRYRPDGKSYGNPSATRLHRRAGWAGWLVGSTANRNWPVSVFALGWAAE